jgi:hypothetical protein
MDPTRVQDGTCVRRTPCAFTIGSDMLAELSLRTGPPSSHAPFASLHQARAALALMRSATSSRTTPATASTAVPEADLGDDREAERARERLPRSPSSSGRGAREGKTDSARKYTVAPAGRATLSRMTRGATLVPAAPVPSAVCALSGMFTCCPFCMRVAPNAAMGSSVAPCNLANELNTRNARSRRSPSPAIK